MKIEIVNPFITGAMHVLMEYIGSEMEQGQLAVRTAIFTTQQVSIIVGVSGEVRGEVIYGMSPVTATKIASAMIGTQYVAFDELSVSAIGELGNMISGQAIMRLAEIGFNCDISPPTVVRGVNVEIATPVPALVVPLYTRCGKIDINIAVIEASELEKAGVA